MDDIIRAVCMTIQIQTSVNTQPVLNLPDHGIDGCVGREQLLDSFIEAEKLKQQKKSPTNPRARRATAQEAQA